jgi:hypothetical protein
MLRDPRFVRAYVALSPLFLAPLLVTRFLPAFDLPHHLAIADALTKASGDSPYARLFTARLELAPFDLHFVILIALSRFMSLTVAIKVLVGAQVLALPLVTARLLAARRRSTVPALLAFPLGYAMPLHYGFIAFVVAVPILIWVFAECVDEAAWAERPTRQAIMVAVLLLACFFAHLEAWAFAVVVAVLCVALQPLSRAQKLLGVAAALPSIVPCVLYFARISKEARFASAPSPLKLLVAERARELREHGVFHDLSGRVRELPIHLLRGFNDNSDLYLAYGFFALVALLALVGHGRAPLTRPRVGAGSVLGVAAVVGYFGLPHHALPHAYSVYPRFAVVLAIVLLLAIPERLALASPRVAGGCTLLVTGALTLHALVLIREYAAFGRELADFEQVVDAVPAGHSAGGLVFDPESRVMNIGGIFTGVPAYYATERRSAQSATYLYYCAWPQLPCRMRDRARPPPLPFFSYPERLDPRLALEEVDVFLVRGGPPVERIFGAETPRVRLLVEHGAWRAFLRR